MATKVKRKSLEHPVELEEHQRQAEISPEYEAASTPLAWLTVETLLYGLIVVAAIGLRLWQLGAYPLSGEEAEQGLVALGLYRGDLPASGQYSPLLLSLNSLTILLFGLSDASARLATVLLGSVLVLLPFTLRRHLGKRVCLLTSALLAISPVALYLSRTLNSEIGVAVGTLMLVAGFFNWVDQGQPRWLWLMAGGLALLLTSGPMLFSIVLVFGLIVLARWSAFKRLLGGALSPDDPGQVDQKIEAAEGEADSSAVAEPTEESNALSQIVETGLRNAAIFLAVSVLLLATTATFNISGFGQIADFLVDWINRFSYQARPEAGFNAVFLLTIYEPFILVAGLTGLAYVLLQRKLLGLVFTGWFVGVLVLDLFMGGRPNGNVILALVPLTFLAAIALSELWEGLSQSGTWGNEGILLGAGLVIAGFAYIGLTGWLVRTCGTDDRLCQFSWLQPVAALSLFIVIVAFFGLMTGTQSALRGAALTAVTLGLLVTTSISWRLNYGPLMHLGYQPLAGIPVSTELVQLSDTLSTQSEIRVGDAALLDTSLVGLDSPALRWRLRDYRHLNQVNALSTNAATTAIITSPRQDEGLDLGQAYVGQDFALDAVWSPVGLPAKTFLQWLIYRQVNDPPQSNQAILWLRVEDN